MTKKVHISILLIFVLAFNGNIAFAQKMTKIQGTVIDAQTKEPLPFVNILFVNTTIGTVTDYDGNFTIETQWASEQLQASFLGYNEQIKNIIIGKTQTINFQLSANDIKLDDIVVKEKRKRYRNKNNPAVDLIKNVIDNKSANSIEAQKFYEFDKHEKVEFDINNISKKLTQRKSLKKFNFIFDYIDTSEINGKPYLPIFLKETVSKVYYRKIPKTEKEYIEGTNIVGFDEYVDNEGISYMIDHLYENTDLYSNNFSLLTNQFISPISDIAPLVYKYMIIDTLMVNGTECIELGFLPRNKQDFAFKGNLYVANDSSYAVVKAQLKITEDINLNFVNDLQIDKEYILINDSIWMLNKDQIVIDFNLTQKGSGMYGKRSVDYGNFLFGKQRHDSIYAGIENTIKADSADARPKEFWEQKRLNELSEQEKNIRIMVDSIQEVPAFKKTMDVIMLLLAGYWNFNYIDIGPVNTFYSFNDVEGLRLRVGGRTSKKMSEKFLIEGYLLYGFKDEKFKYSASTTWSLNKNPLFENPCQTLKFTYQVETNFPGMEMQFINEDNFLLSFKRGKADKILYYTLYDIEHFKDWGHGLSSTVNLKHTTLEPGGTLAFDYTSQSIDKIVTTEVPVKLLFTPNGQYYQGSNYRHPIISKHPIYQLSYTQGIKNMLNADYGYGKAIFNVFKRFQLSPFGFSDVEIEAGKVFGKGIPYPLLFVHRANQTYSYQQHSYNLMNFLEFVSDEYISLNIEHHFNGFFLNKTPVIKKLKLREIISLKAIYGGISKANNPLKNSDLMLFPHDESGNTTTYTLNKKPYIEASVGIGNILKFFRVDLIRRFSYLDNPNVTEYGIRGRFKFDF